MNWSWLAIATPALICGWFLGLVAARHLALSREHRRDAVTVLVVLALGSFVVAYLNVSPLLSNVVALFLLSAATGMRRGAPPEPKRT